MRNLFFSALVSLASPLSDQGPYEYYGDGNENVKKAIGLMSKTTILHVHHAFFVHFFAILAQLRREMTKF